jgi:methanogenic corrinoid protein MtbC1
MASGRKAGVAGSIVLRVVESYVDDIGENLVKMMVEAAGLKAYDRGREVSSDKSIYGPAPPIKIFLTGILGY